jgi:hypothetical protein
MCSNSFLPRHVVLLDNYPTFEDMQSVQVRFVIIYPAALVLRRPIKRALIPRTVLSGVSSVSRVPTRRRHQQ